jgi:hypothetical protein
MHLPYSVHGTIERQGTEGEYKRREKNNWLSRDFIRNTHPVPDRDRFLDPWHPEELAAR